MTADFITIPKPIQRDQWGRPLITPPDGGKAVAYTRATTVAGAIDDLNGLINWKISTALRGAVERPDLILGVAAHHDDKKRMKQLVEECLEAGGASTKANMGTAIHSLTERLDRGQPLGTVPEQFRADIAAYTDATTGLEPVEIEQMCVVDDLKIAGTPDLLVRCADGVLRIADKKTGSIDYPHKMAAQLAIYAHASKYNPETGQRSSWGDVDQEKAIIIHLPVGEGRCELHYIDIAAGWEAVQLAMQVRQWRSRKGITTPYSADVVSIRDVEDSIILATTIDELVSLWTKYESIWTDECTELAASKKALINGGLN
jgi:hypothetical protein